MLFSDLMDFEYFIFDGDGTLFDTNRWKYQNILNATKSVGIDDAKAESFAQKFIYSSGVPRENKVYAEYDLEIGIKILDRYSKLNAESLHEVRLVSGAKNILQRLEAEKKKVILYSAGDPREVMDILKHHNIERYFSFFLLGREKVSANLAARVQAKTAVYFGDALKDYLTAKELGYSFVYVDGYIIKSMQFLDGEMALWGRIKSYLDIEGV